MEVKKEIFKAYDVRGKYPEELNEEVFSLIAENLSKILKGKIVVGCDARLSSPSLKRAVIKGLEHSNVLKNVRMKIIEVGMVTTPMFYFLVNKLKADGGVMVTASHNPKEYNGLKIVGPKAKPISGEAVGKLVIDKKII